MNRNREILLEAGKDFVLEINIEKPKYMVVSPML